MIKDFIGKYIFQNVIKDYIGKYIVQYMIKDYTGIESENSQETIDFTNPGGGAMMQL